MTLLQVCLLQNDNQVLPNAESASYPPCIHINCTRFLAFLDGIDRAGMDSTKIMNFYLE